MPVSTYALTGFLDAGKTTLLQYVLDQQGSRDMRILVLQFEQGETELNHLSSSVVLRTFSPKRAEAEPEALAGEIAVLFAPGTILYFIARREQGKAVFDKTSDWVIFAVIAAAAVYGVYGLATGSISI